MPAAQYAAVSVDHMHPIGHLIMCYKRQLHCRSVDEGHDVRDGAARVVGFAMAMMRAAMPVRPGLAANGIQFYTGWHQHLTRRAVQLCCIWLRTCLLLNSVLMDLCVPARCACLMASLYN
jgi:hypothetical protein